MIDNVVYKRSVSECVKIGYLQQQKIHKIPISSVRPHPIQKSWVCHCSAPVLKMKNRHLCICVSCHFVCILLGSFCDHCKNVWYNLFSGRPSKVLPWSWLKSLCLGLGTRSLGLGLGLEVQSLGLGLGLDKKSLIYITTVKHSGMQHTDGFIPPEHTHTTVWAHMIYGRFGPRTFRPLDVSANN